MLSVVSIFYVKKKFPATLESVYHHTSTESGKTLEREGIQFSDQSDHMHGQAMERMEAKRLTYVGLTNRTPMVSREKGNLIHCDAYARLLKGLISLVFCCCVGSPPASSTGLGVSRSKHKLGYASKGSTEGHE